jgi:type IV pilus assembly protein PilM
MARRLIGLDVGTNAVTIAEVTPGSPPRLDMFAQVALPREAMREGEVADELAVTDAVSRLRAEVGLKKAAVRVGIASPRVIVRQVEMPVMTRAELQSALQFQAADLIPISLDDAVLDFAILGQNEDGGEGGEPTMQVLLAAAQEATIMKLVSSVEAGGLQVQAVDLIPLALTRALAHPVPAMANAGAAGGVVLADDIGAEGIVSFGGGVTAISVHEGGVPRFVRVLSGGGRELTDAISHELSVPPETAEALKRALGNPQTDETVERARSAIDRPLSVLLDEVRSSLDYYRNQPGASRLVRVVATGGTAQLPGLPERLSALVGVQVDPAYMHDLIRVGDIGFAPDELPRLEPYLPAAVGLALGGAGVGTVVDLRPRARRSSAGGGTSARINPKVAAAAMAGIVVLGGLTLVQHSKVSSANSKKAEAQVRVEKLSNQVERLTAEGSPTGQAANLQAQVAGLLGEDVGWQRMVGDIGAALPDGAWLTSFQGQHTVLPPVVNSQPPSSRPAGGEDDNNKKTEDSESSDKTATAGGASSAATAAGATTATPVADGKCASYQKPLAGVVTMTGVARDLPTLSTFLKNLAVAGGADNPRVGSVWLANAQASKFGAADVVAFTINASLADGSRSDRLRTYFKEALCK